MSALRRLATCLAALAAFASTTLAQDGDYPAKLKAADADRASVAPGGTFSVKIDVEIDAGWHAYGLAQSPDAGVPTTISAAGGGWPAGLTAGAPTESPTPSAENSSLGKQLVHKGKVSFALPFMVALDAEPGSREITGELSLQACNDSMCKPPQTFAFKAYVDVSPVRIARAEFVPAAATAGGEATLEMEFAIAKGWHVYAQRHPDYKPPTFEWKAPAGWTTKGGLVEVTPPHEEDECGTKLFVHTEKAVLRQTFVVGKDAKAGAFEVQGAGSWQRCDDKGCTDDKDVPVAAKLTVAGAASAPSEGAKLPPAAPTEGANSSAPATPADAPADDAMGQDIWSILLSGAGWGLVTILTPCVFPLLPVTVSFFSKQTGHPLPRSSVYAAGIVFTFTVIGLIFKGTLDSFSRGTAFNLFVAALFIALALSLFGLFELRLPSFLIDRSQAKSGAGGLVGVFFMAVTLALTSFSCTMPFLAIMFQRFDRGDQVHATVGLLAYGSTVALPFFLCSLFPALLKTLPRSGGWLNAVKVTMGFVEFGFAFKFLRTVALNEGSDVLSRSLVLAVWTACAIGAAVYLLGYITLPHDTKAESIGVIRLLFALFFLTLACWFVSGVFGRPLHDKIDGFIQSESKDFAAGGGANSEASWPRDDWDGALARAAEKKRPALFDFTGVG